MTTQTTDREKTLDELAAETERLRLYDKPQYSRRPNQNISKVVPNAEIARLIATIACIATRTHEESLSHDQ